MRFKELKSFKEKFTKETIQEFIEFYEATKKETKWVTWLKNKSEL